MLTRRADWATRLHNFLSERGADRFAYGRVDCCLWVADAVLGMTGIDPAAPLRGRYRSLREARVLMREYAGRPSVAAVVAAITAEHKMPEIPPLTAQRGDVVLVSRSRDYSLGLLDLNGRDILSVGRDGLLRLSLSRAARAWRV